MTAVHQHHSETSREAAERIVRVAPTLRDRVLMALAMRPMTDEELCEVTQIPPSTERPRRVELVAERIVRDSGERRKTRSGRNAVVWCVTEPDGTQLTLL